MNLFKEFKTARPNLSWCASLMRHSSCPGTKGDKPNFVWSGLKHSRTDAHGKHSDPWSEL